MKNTLTAVALLFMWFFGAVPAVADKISVEEDESVRKIGNFHYQDWADLLFPLLPQIRVIPPTLQKVKVTVDPNPDPNLPADKAHCPDTILIGPGNLPSWDDLTNAWAQGRSFWHEFNHLASCGYLGLVPDFFHEALADATAYAGMTLADQADPSNPRLRLVTAVPMSDLRLNYSKDSVAGEENFYKQRRYADVAGLLEEISGGQYKDMDLALSQPRSGESETLESFLSVLDQVFPDFDGAKPSDRMTASPVASYFNGPDGKFLFLEVYAGYFDPLVDNNGRKIGAELPIINSSATIVWSVKERVNGVSKSRTDGFLKWIIKDVTGKTVLSGVSSRNRSGSFQFETTALPDSGNQFFGCWVQEETTECNPADTNLSAAQYFTVLRNVQDPWKDLIVVFANGYDYSQFDDSVKLQLVKKEGSPVEAANYPGMLVVRLHGSRESVEVTDGIRSRTFTPAYRDPVYAYTPTRFVPWAGLYDQMVAIQSATDWVTGYLVPGGIFVAWGVDLTNNPSSAEEIPLPTTLDGIQVIVRSQRTDYVCPLLYASQYQVNFQVPEEVPPGPAEIRFMLSGKSTNNVRVLVEERKPSLFYLDWDQQIPIADFASGPKAGQLVLADNPARPGDTITLYGSGLGRVNPPAKTGDVPAQAAAAIAPLEMTVGGKPAQVLFAGRTAAMPGLDMITVIIPQEATAGLNPLVIVSGTQTSAQGVIPIER